MEHVAGRRRTAAVLSGALVAAAAVTALAADGPRCELLPARDGVANPPLLPVPLASFGAARDGAWLYVYSGHMGPVHAHQRESLWEGFARLNLIDGAWEHLPGPQRLQGLALVAHGGRVIRVGGLEARNRAGEEEDLHSVADVEAFDPLTRQWSALPPLPEPRSSHDAVVHADKLYVVGGWGLAGELRRWHDTAWVLDLQEPGAGWEALPKPPFETRALSVVAADGKLLVLGGMTWEDELTRAVHVYDPEAQSWSRGPDLPFPGFGVAAVAIDRDVYASGLDSAMFRLGLYSDEPEWERLGSLAFPRYFHRLIALGDERLLALGGVARPGGHLRVNEVLDYGRDAQRPRLTRYTVPVAARAKNRQGVLLQGDTLYLFGGNSGLDQHGFAAERFLSDGVRFDLARLRERPGPAFPERRQSMVTASLPKAGIAIGGFGHTGEGTTSWPDIFRYDPQAERWDLLGRLPGPRTQFGLAEWEGKLYAFGGVDYDSSRPRSEAFQYPSDVAVIDSTTGAVQSAGITLPRPRRAFGGALVGSRYYLVGGMQAGFELVEPVDVYDFATGEWSTSPAPEELRLSPETVSLGGKLYLFGGSSPAGDDVTPNESLIVFDPATERWSTLLQELPFSSRHARMLPWRDRLLVISTHVEGPGALQLLVIEP